MKQQERQKIGMMDWSDRNFERRQEETVDEYRERLFEDHKKAVEETRQKECNR